jgi:hypothetical protein
MKILYFILVVEVEVNPTQVPDTTYPAYCTYLQLQSCLFVFSLFLPGLVGAWVKDFHHLWTLSIHINTRIYPSVAHIVLCASWGKLTYLIKYTLMYLDLGITSSTLVL